jgi:putative spermidine/putrescine transport system permease protein
VIAAVHGQAGQGPQGQADRKVIFSVRAGWLLLLLPVLAFFVVFFAAPLLYMVATSFLPPITSGLEPQFTLQNYRVLLQDPFYREILVRTVRIASIASLITLVLGYPIAYLLRVVSPMARARLLLLVISPLLVSVVVRTYAWIVVLGKQGLLNALLGAIGVDDQYAKATHLFNETAVAVGLAHVFFPFMVLAIYSALQKVDLTLTAAAQNLGATPLRAFFEVTLPLSVPGVQAGLMTVFPLMLGSFITVAVLGGPRVWVVSMSAYQNAMGLMNWQLAGAIGVALLVLAAASTWAISFLAGSVVRRVAS